jgi:hypothetical protein
VPSTVAAASAQSDARAIADAARAAVGSRFLLRGNPSDHNLAARFCTNSKCPATKSPHFQHFSLIFLRRKVARVRETRMKIRKWTSAAQKTLEPITYFKARYNALNPKRPQRPKGGRPPKDLFCQHGRLIELFGVARFRRCCSLRSRSLRGKKH